MTTARSRPARAGAIISGFAAGAFGYASPSYAAANYGCRSNRGNGFAFTLCVQQKPVGDVHPTLRVAQVPGGNCTVSYNLADDTAHTGLLSGSTGCRTCFWDLALRPANGHDYGLCATPMVNGQLAGSLKTCAPNPYAN